MNAAELVARAKVVLLDFDGPVCSVFAGYPPVRAVSASLRALEVEGYDPKPEWLGLEDPHRLITEVALEMPKAVRIVENALTRSELEAVDTAEVTQGVVDLIDQVEAAGHRWAIVSNNSSESIDRFCDRPDFGRNPDLIVGRAKRLPMLMKPHPAPLLGAMDLMHVEPHEVVFVGDSVSDVEAGTAAEVAVIGYANKFGKDFRLSRAGAVEVVRSMRDLIAPGSSPPPVAT